MATRVIKTRIQNKLDTLDAWYTENPKLLYGEIAVVQTVEQKVDKDGATSEVPIYLIKVGNGSDFFDSLPWLKAEAADVYDWAKSEKAENVSVAITSGDIVETKTLKEWFEYINAIQIEQDGAIRLNTAKLAGHTDAAINSLIDTKLNGLASVVDTESATGSLVVKSVAQIAGKVYVAKGPLLEADLPELHANKIIVADATGNIEKVTLNAKLDTLATDIGNINTAIAGGVHFIGITTTDLSQASHQTASSITLKLSDGTTKAYTAKTGDITIQDNTSKEYIWSGSLWQELGDQSRIGAIETKINNMDLADVATTNQYVTQVTQTDGKITVSRKQPVSTEILHGDGGSTTVGAELANHVGRLIGVEDKLKGVTTTVSTAIADAIKTLDVSESTTDGTATAFIKSLKQEDGKIIAAKASLPTASTTASGIVKLNDNTNSTSVTEAATANAVKKAYDVANASTARADAIEGNYLRVNTTDSKIYLGKLGVDEIIFDCGTAPIS